jgi:hypothetical protein
MIKHWRKNELIIAAGLRGLVFAILPGQAPDDLLPILHCVSMQML